MNMIIRSQEQSGIVTELRLPLSCSTRLMYVTLSSKKRERARAEDSHSLVLLALLVLLTVLLIVVVVSAGAALLPSFSSPRQAVHCAAAVATPLRLLLLLS